MFGAVTPLPNMASSWVRKVGGAAHDRHCPPHTKGFWSRMNRRLTDPEDCTALHSLCVSAPDDTIHQNDVANTQSIVHPYACPSLSCSIQYAHTELNFPTVNIRKLSAVSGIIHMTQLPTSSYNALWPPFVVQVWIRPLRSICEQVD